METIENKTHMGRFCNGRRPKAHWIILGVIGFTAWLWNGLMPVIFHLGLITYWQAIGLAILARLLFGGMHHGGRHHGGRGHFMWRHGNRMRQGGSDATMRWSYYEQYWNEEGEKAFNDYVRRKTEASGA